MLTISATFDLHLLLPAGPAHIFVTLAYLVHIHIEQCILHSSLLALAAALMLTSDR
jgi:hypothetical protein